MLSYPRQAHEPEDQENLDSLLYQFLTCAAIQTDEATAFAWFWKLDEYIRSLEIDDLPDKSGDQLPMEENGQLTDAGCIYFRAWCRRHQLADL